MQSLEELLRNAPLMIVVDDGTERRIELFNLPAREASCRRDLAGKTLAEAFPELEPYLRKIAECVRSGRTYVGANEPLTLDWCGDGKLETRYLTFIYHPVTRSDRNVERSVMIAFDVTASLAGPGGVSGALAWLHAALDAIPIPVLLAEPGTARIVFANAAARQLSLADAPSDGMFARAMAVDSGCFCTDATGAPIADRDLPAVRASRGEPVDGIEVRWHSPSGVLSLLSFAETIPPTAELPSFIVLSFFDVSPLRALQRERTDAEAEREEFVSVVAHELRTPVTALKLRTQALLKQRPEAEGIAAVERASARMEGLIERMLQAEAIRTSGVRPRPEEMDLCEVVERVIRQLGPDAQRLHTTISREGARELRGRWDENLAETVFSNLVRNALRFGVQTPVTITCTDLGDSVSVAVSDEGIGIAPADQQRIFDRFGRAAPSRHFGGLGLGLWVSRAMVEAMGGTIRVRSARGHGATFIVELPKSHPPP